MIKLLRFPYYKNICQIRSRTRRRRNYHYITFSEKELHNAKNDVKSTIRATVKELEANQVFLEILFKLSGIRPKRFGFEIDKQK